MHYGKIPEKVLDINLYESYDESLGFYNITVRETLDQVGEDIICSDYKTDIVDGKLILSEFVAWTKHTVFILILDGLDRLIVSVPRHPYSFVYKAK